MPWNDELEAERLNRDALLLVEERGELGLWSWDFEHGRVRWSIGMYRLLGLPPFVQEPSGDLYNSVVHPADRVDRRDTFRILHTIGDHPHRIIRRDGQMRWVRSCGRVVHNANGLPERVVGVTFDITDRTRADFAYQRESGLFDAVRELFGGAIWMTAADGNAADPSDQRLTTERYNAGHLGWGRLDDVHPDDRHAVQQAWASALTTGRRYAADYRENRDGVYADTSSRAVAIRDPSGAILAWIGYTSPQQQPESLGDPSAREMTPTAGQVRGARGLLGWTATDLAERSGLSFSTIRRAETDGDRVVGVSAVNAIRRTFAAAGIQFGVTIDGTVTLSLRPPEPRPEAKQRAAPMRKRTGRARPT